MPYLNLDLDYFEHPKTRRLVGILGSGADILPIRLWCYVGKFHSDNGSLPTYSIPEIEAIVGWNGEQGVLVAALLKIGFITEKNSCFSVNDWREHSGHISKLHKRSIAANRKRWKDITRTPLRTPKTDFTAPPSIPSIPSIRAKKSKSFVPPTPQEASTYFVATLQIAEGEAAAFVDHYTANGWVQGRQGKPIVDWKAAARNWKRNQNKFSRGNNGLGRNTPIPGTQAARASFRHGPEELRRLEELKATLDARDRERDKRAGPH